MWYAAGPRSTGGAGGRAQLQCHLKVELDFWLWTWHFQCHVPCECEMIVSALDCKTQLPKGSVQSLALVVHEASFRYVIALAIIVEASP